MKAIDQKDIYAPMGFGMDQNSLISILKSKFKLGGMSRIHWSTHNFDYYQ